MLLIIVRHHVRQGQMAAAQKRIGKLTAAMAEQPGLVFRHSGLEEKLSSSITTITAWLDRNALANWVAVRATLDLSPSAEGIYEKVEEIELTPYDLRWGSLGGDYLAGFGKASTPA